MKIAVERAGIEALTKLNCDHVIFSNNENQHCDKNDNAGKRGACCSSCWTRKWAEKVIAEHQTRSVASRAPCSCSADDLLTMLKWLVGFKCPTDARAIIDAEPIKQAENLIRRYESQHGSA